LHAILGFPNLVPGPAEHSVEGWEELLLPEIELEQKPGKAVVAKWRKWSSSPVSCFSVQGTAEHWIK
jgi:hypothetical protein